MNGRSHAHVDLIDELTYASYRYNRDRSPEIIPADWAQVFRDVPGLEARYQAERGRVEGSGTEFGG